jgi:hypothetical protein
MLQNCALPCVPLTGIAKCFATETARVRSDNGIQPREDRRGIGVHERGGSARAFAVGDTEPISADLREAFDQAVNALIAWDGVGEEPTVSVHGRLTRISVVASLVETYKDTMPTSLYWRLVNYAHRYPKRRPEAAKLTADSSYETGAGCLLRWVEDAESSQSPEGG